MIRFVFLIGCLSSLFSQDIQVNVKVTAERLTAFEKDEIRYLKDAIENYVNSYDWTDTDNDEVIPCDLSLIIETVTEINGEREYKAQFLASSPARENFYDKNVLFRYASTEELRHMSPEYHSLANFLDFYVSMILGGELDTYTEFGGDRQYARAREALTKAQNSSFAGNWSYREKIYLDSSTPLVRTLRLAKLNYYIAANLRDAGEFSEARKVAYKMIEHIRDAYVNQPNNTMLKRFFEGYHKWIVELLDPSQDQHSLKELVVMDPVRKGYYSKYMSN